jgi:hypothetical protein
LYFVNDFMVASVFCIAWVVARRFRKKGAAEALAYARAVAATAVNPIR